MLKRSSIASVWRVARLGCVAGAAAAAAASGLPAVTAAQNIASAPAGLVRAAPPAADMPPAAGVAGDSEIRRRLEASTPVIAGEKLHGDLLRRFYAGHGFEPFWPTRPAQAAALLGAVWRAEAHGLDPDLFHAAALRNPALPPIDRDLLQSDAVLGYADALARGALPIERRLDDEDLTPEPIDIVATVDNAIGSPDPAAAIEALAPHGVGYPILQRALQDYRQRSAASAEPTPRRGRRPAEGTTDAARLRSIIVNLERLRWLPRHLPPERVWVNIANAELALYRDDRPIFTTRVVVGETDKQTPELQTSIDSVMFNPPWNVPTSIANKEILPKLGAQPDYLARHHMVLRHNGAIQQLAGPYSALGRLKFEMANRFDVYLHDTPLKALFSRDNRRQSHGCVRVQNPRELAALLLQQPVEAIDKAIALGYTNRRALPAPVPVYFVYQTVFVDANGAVEFRPDVYDRDDEIWQHLQPATQTPVAEREPGGQRRG